MAINVSALNSTLQVKIDALDAATDTKEVLLLSKALDAAAGSTSVSDILGEGVVQVNNVNSEGSAQIANVQATGATERTSVQGVLGNYTPTSSLHNVATSGDYSALNSKPTFKTVGGTAILGSGDIQAGGILQVKTIQSSTYSSHNSSWGYNSDSIVPDLQVTITPKSTSSKMLVFGHIWVSTDNNSWRHYNASLWRNTTVLTKGSITGNHTTGFAGGLFEGLQHSHRSLPFHELDSPNTTSALTYKIGVGRGTNGSYNGTVWVNRTGDPSTSYTVGVVSSMTVMEVVV